MWRSPLGEDLYRLLTPKFELPIAQYKNQIQEVQIGGIPPDGTRAYGITLGGSKNLPLFEDREGTIAGPHIAMQVQVSPENIPVTVSETLGDLPDDPVEWAKFCTECGAEIIQLKFNLPSRRLLDRSLEEFIEISQRLIKEISVPVIFSGPDLTEIDPQILETVASATKGERVLLASARLDNDYPRIAKAAIDNKHVVLASTDCDPPSQKMLNERLLGIGLPPDQIVMDPTTAALGYGLEYSLSIAEQIRLNALKGDKSLQMPIVAFPANSWTAREANLEDLRYGDLYSRGLIWELTTALTMFLAGAELLVMLHPESVRRFKTFMRDQGFIEPSVTMMNNKN